VNAPDTSVVVAAFASWHEHHAVADERLGRLSRLIAHVATETVSTLTRLPDPFRVEAASVWEFLQQRFRGEWIAPNPNQHRDILGTAIGRGVSGGAIYDAMIAGIAVAGGLTLLSLDRRAEPTYRRIGATYDLLA